MESDFSISQSHKISKYNSNWPVVTNVNIPVLFLDLLFIEKRLPGIYFLEANENYFKYVYAIEIAQLLIEQRLALSVKAKINLMNNIRQQSFTHGPANVTPNPSNAFGSTPDLTSLIEVLLAQISLIQAPPLPAYLI